MEDKSDSDDEEVDVTDIPFPTTYDPTPLLTKPFVLIPPLLTAEILSYLESGFSIQANAVSLLVDEEGKKILPQAFTKNTNLPFNFTHSDLYC